MCWDPNNEILSLLTGVRGYPCIQLLTQKATLDVCPGFQSALDRKCVVPNFPHKRSQKVGEEVIHPCLLEQTRWMNAFHNNEDKRTCQMWMLSPIKTLPHCSAILANVLWINCIILFSIYSKNNLYKAICGESERIVSYQMAEIWPLMLLRNMLSTTNLLKHIIAINSRQTLIQDVFSLCFNKPTKPCLFTICDLRRLCSTQKIKAHKLCILAS